MFIVNADIIKEKLLNVQECSILSCVAQKQVRTVTISRDERGLLKGDTDLLRLFCFT